MEDEDASNGEEVECRESGRGEEDEELTADGDWWSVAAAATAEEPERAEGGAEAECAAAGRLRDGRMGSKLSLHAGLRRLDMLMRADTKATVCVSVVRYGLLSLR